MLPSYIRDTDPPAKREILRAAMKLFSEHGLAATTVRDIAKVSGYTNPALYKHFVSKEELALYLFETSHRRLWSRCHAAIESATDFDGKLENYIGEVLSLTDEHPEAMMFLSENARVLWPKSGPAVRRQTMIALARSLMSAAAACRKGIGGSPGHRGGESAGNARRTGAHDSGWRCPRPGQRKSSDDSAGWEEIEMFRDIDFLWTMRWIRADGVAILVAALWAVTFTHGSWAWFFALILLPDLSMSGYLFGSRAGAVVYNTGHMYAWPVALLAIGFTRHSPFTTTAALSWIAHVALDQVVGYGLKLPTMFEHTVLGPIGRLRRTRASR